MRMEFLIESLKEYDVLLIRFTIASITGETYCFGFV